MKVLFRAVSNNGSEFSDHLYMVPGIEVEVSQQLLTCELRTRTCKLEETPVRHDDIMGENYTESMNRHKSLIESLDNSPRRLAIDREEAKVFEKFLAMRCRDDSEYGTVLAEFDRF